MGEDEGDEGRAIIESDTYALSTPEDIHQIDILSDLNFNRLNAIAEITDNLGITKNAQLKTRIITDIKTIVEGENIGEQCTQMMNNVQPFIEEVTKILQPEIVEQKEQLRSKVTEFAKISQPILEKHGTQLLDKTTDFAKMAKPVIEKHATPLLGRANETKRLVQPIIEKHAMQLLDKANQAARLTQPVIGKGIAHIRDQAEILKQSHAEIYPLSESKLKSLSYLQDTFIVQDDLIPKDNESLENKIICSESTSSIYTQKDKHHSMGGLQKSKSVGSININRDEATIVKNKKERMRQKKARSKTLPHPKKRAHTKDNVKKFGQKTKIVLESKEKGVKLENDLMQLKIRGNNKEAFLKKKKQVRKKIKRNNTLPYQNRKRISHHVYSKTTKNLVSKMYEQETKFPLQKSQSAGSIRIEKENPKIVISGPDSTINSFKKKKRTGKKTY